MKKLKEIKVPRNDYFKELTKDNKYIADKTHNAGNIKHNLILQKMKQKNKRRKAKLETKKHGG